MKRKQYYIPIVEIIVLSTEIMQDSDFALAGSPSHGQAGAPERRDPAF